MRKNEVRVYTRVIEGHNALHYAYQATQDMTFMFNHVSEVGEPWKPEAQRLAKALAARRECRIVEVELKARPWVAEVLVPL